jgi:hypothetical protein
MRHIMRFVLAALLSFVALHALAQQSQKQSTTPAPTSTEAPATNELRTRLIGEWEEFSPSRNFIDIASDGRIVLYLKKGEIGDLKTLDGTWTLDDAGTLHVEFTVKGDSITQSAKLSFDGDEMRLVGIENPEPVTRHRKRSGPLPEEYRW